MDYTRVQILAVGVFLFLTGYFLRDIGETVLPATQAEVAGMDWSDLRNDYDFKKAVGYVVENNCEVDYDGEDLSC